MTSQQILSTFALLLVISAQSSDAWFNFDFQLSGKTFGLEDFPKQYNSLLKDSMTIAELTKTKSLASRFDDFLQRCTKFDWNDHLQGYFIREGLSTKDIQYLRQMNISYLMQQMPRYNLDHFLDVPIKTLVYRTAFYFTRNGTEETYDMLSTIYVKNDQNVATRITEFKAESNNATYIHWDEKHAINKRILGLIEILQFDETSDFLKQLDASSQVNYLTSYSFDYVNKMMARLVFHKIQSNVVEIKEYNTKIIDITSKIQLLHSSIFQWSLSCQSIITDVVFTKATLDSISDRCFNLPFSQTAHILYGISKERGKFLGTFDMTSASRIAQSPYQNVSLQPAKEFIDDLIRGLAAINKAKSLPYYEYSRKTWLKWDHIENQPIGTILAQIQKLPWEVLRKAYGVETASTSLQYIPFKRLGSLVKDGTNSSFLAGSKRLRTVSADVIFDAVEGRISDQHLRVAYRANVLALCSKPLLSLSYLYTFKINEVKSKSLYSLCNVMFNIRIEEFLQYFGVETNARPFFTMTSLEDFGLLLGLDLAALQRFSVRQIIDQIKPEWTFAEAMLHSPASYIKEGNQLLADNIQFSIPQIVDTYHDTINSARAFTAYIKVWSKSEETANIVREESVKQLAQRLKIEVADLADMKVLDIINTLIISFGDKCDLSRNYCAVLQKCVETAAGGRCRCENGYRFSKDKTCIDLNECLFANVTCSGNAKCINKQPFFECKCKGGFTGDGYTCSNVNECEDNTHNCAPDTATCIDTEGAFQCSCNLGYEGDGRRCKDVNECINTNLHNCHRHATCSNEIGSYSCKCKPGFSGDGRFCFDVDECKRREDNCPYNADCKNTQGSFECVCRSPYVKSDDGVRCSQCNRGNVENCHADAICLSGKCTCKDGYLGDGESCEDINECEKVVDVCGRGRCSNTKGDFECTCTNGYSSTPQNKKCIDINECNQPRGNLLCNGTGEVCSNTDGGYACLTVKSDKAVKIALGTAIPLIIVMFIGIFIIWFMHRRHKGKKELDDFDKKLRQMYHNEAYSRDDESQVSGMSSRPIAPRGARMSLNNFMGANKTFMNIFKKTDPDDVNKTAY